MTDTALPKPRRRMAPLLIGVALAAAAGGGGFYATTAGLLPLPEGDAAPAAPMPDVAFVPVPPLVISLGPTSRHRHLRFAAQVEVAPGHAAEVTHLMPRIVDVVNGYLRAVDPAELEATAALVRLRAQLLRRIQIVTGEGRVTDLLVSEFVLN